LVALPQLPLQPLPSFLFSVLAARRRQGKDDAGIADAVSYIGALVMAIFSFFFMLLTEPIIRMCFSAQWLQATSVVMIMMALNVIFLPSLILVAFLNASGHSFACLMLTGLGCLLLWALASAGVQVWGETGFAVGSLIACILTFIAQSVANYKLTKRRIPWQGPIRLLLVIFLALCLPSVFVHKQSAQVIWGTTPKQAVESVCLFLLLLFIAERKCIRTAYATCKPLFIAEHGARCV
jgi:O-antigen/teichoic acid export membrane protein